MPSLNRLQTSAKLLITALMAAMGMNHAFAGWLAWEVSHAAAGSEKEHFQYKSLIYLLRMSHQHAFGHGVMYFAVGAVFLCSTLPDGIKSCVVIIPFLGATMDLTSWWLMKYTRRDFEWLSMAGGMLFSLGFSFMALRTFYELWLTGPGARSDEQGGGV